MKSKEEGQEGFVMVHQRDLESAISLVATRKLELRDMAVFMGLMAHMNWRSGRVPITAKALAERLGIKLPVCVSSLTRLKKEMLVARVVDRNSGDNYYLLNPYVASVGGPQRRGLLWAQFKATLE
jgi:hypothetical protein